MNPSDEPTLPLTPPAVESLPTLPLRPNQPPVWSQPAGGGPPPTPRLSRKVLAIVGAALIVALLLALLIGLLAASRGGASTVRAGSSAQRTATARSQSTHSLPTTNAAPTIVPTAAPTTAPTPPPQAQPPSVEIRQNYGPVTAGNPLTVSCPSNELALSGGWNSGAANVYYSGRYGNGWQISAYGTGLSATVYVLCLQNAPGVSVTERSTSVSVPSGEEFGLASCNADDIVVGGGFANPTNNAVVVSTSTALVKSGSNGWYGAMTNSSSTPLSVTIFVECLSAPRGQSSLGELRGTGAGGSTMQVTRGTGGNQSSCPAGSLLTGGGYFNSLDAFSYTYISRPTNGSTWEVSIENNTDNTDNLSVGVQCISFTKGS